MIPARFFSRLNRNRAAPRWAARAGRLDESWAEPWVAMGALWAALDKPEVAFEALMGASGRDPFCPQFTVTPRPLTGRKVKCRPQTFPPVGDRQTELLELDAMNPVLQFGPGKTSHESQLR